jgi:hypothetical protein
MSAIINLTEEQSNLADEANLGEHIERSLDNIDAAVFSSDMFMPKASASRLLMFMKRWLGEIKPALEGSYEEGYVEPAAALTPDIDLAIKFKSADTPPEEHGSYSVMVLKDDGDYIITDAVYCHPEQSVYEGWFVGVNDNPQHLRNVAYYADTKAIKLSPNQIPNKPKLG